MRSIWLANANKQEQSLQCFEGIDEFLVFASDANLDKSIPIYIDSQLGDVKGEVESEKFITLALKTFILQQVHQKRIYISPIG